MFFIIKFIKFLIKLYFLIFVIIHILFFSISNTLVQYLTFQNFLNFPSGNLSNPLEFSLINVHNFYINTENNIRIGIWHFIPNELNYKFEVDGYRDIHEHMLKYLKTDQRPIIIYVHGNAHNRAFVKRRELCLKLNNLGYHVFSIDYRGYGDSSGFPTEEGVVHDTISIFNFLRKYRNESSLYLWGHSLGTAIVAHASKNLSELNFPPAGVIFESAFLNMSHASTEYLISPFFYNNQWIIDLGNQALKYMDIHFETDNHIVKIKSKILIFHAEDDWFIPHDRGFDLLRIAETQRPKNYPKVELKILDKEHGLGHGNIYKHEEIYEIVKTFIQ